MGQQIPAIGQDVTALMPSVGDDVTHLMGGGADFKATNEPPSPSMWEQANTPLIPQIQQAAHAISDYLSQPRQGDQELNDHIKGLGTASAMLRGGAAGMVEGAGNVLSGFTSPVGVALMLTGLTGDSAIVKQIPALKTLLDLPAVKGLQRAVQAGAGAVFTAHGVGQVATAPTLAGKAQGVVEAATGALGMASAVPTPSRANQPLLVNPNAAESAAAQFGLAHGVPVDVGMATGNKAVKGIQFLADRSLGGSLVAGPAREAQTAALAKVGGELADQSFGRAAAPEQAGQGIRDALVSKQQAHTALADASYEKLRQIEEQQPIPVDTRGAKAAIQPLYDQMMRQMPLTQRQASPGLQAMENILNGPDVAPLSQVDRDLSAIKAVARESGGLGKFAAGKLDNAVQSAAANAGPDAVRALNQGRQATIAKVQTEDLIGALPGGKMEEPLAIFKRATAPKDGGIEFLRAVKEHTPQALPQIARAKLEEVLTMTPDNQFREWQKLGTETRKILFPQVGQSQALDHFFLLSKRLAENPNPSGTAMVASLGVQGGLLANPITFIPALLSEVGAAGVSAMLHNPNVARALTQTLSVAATPAASGAARAAALASLSSAVRRAGLPALSPALGQDESRLATGAARK